MKLIGNDLFKQAGEILRTYLAKVPFVQIESVTQERLLGTVSPDILATISIGEKRKEIAVEVKNNGQPKIVREFTYKIDFYKQGMPGAYCIFAAPYISPEAAEICTKNDIGYFDLAGNCRIAFDNVYIEQKGFPNPLVKKREQRSLYSTKATRILRAMLEQPRYPWRVQTLSKEARVSIGQVFNVKKLLENREWLRSTSEGFYLAEPDKLLSEWADNYEFKKNQAKNYYSLKSISEIEKDLASACRGANLPYALTGFSGAERFIPFVRYQKAMAYVGDNVDEIAKTLSLKEVTSGANVTLLTPYDEGVLYKTRTFNGIDVASPVQIYIDLLTIRGRGEEAASEILEVIKESW